MGHAGIYGNHHYHHALYLYQTRKPGSYALGTTESARHDHRSLGSIPHDTLPHHQDGAHHCPDGFACLVVSRHHEINRMFPNLDHIFAGWEQDLFGCQPALLFAKALPWAVVSELMSMGYFMYYPMIALVSFYYFFCRYYEAERAAFVMLTSFFIYYLIYIYVPVVGPTFYFDAVGISEITKGIFPALGDYFNTHTNCLPTPGYTDGIFYQLVEDAKNAGERPTAAFPSSHVGVSTICMLLVWHTGNRKLLYVMLPFYIFLCLATVYIQAHYLIDAIAGLISAVVIYFALMAVSKGMIEHHTPSSRLRFR